MDVSAEEKATSDSGRISGEALSPTDNITAIDDLTVGMKEVKSPPKAHEESVAFQTSISDDNGSPGRNLETPERENSGPAPDEAAAAAAVADEPEKEEPAADLVGETTGYEECLRLLRELREERDEARRRSGRLQTELAPHDCEWPTDGAEAERKLPASEQLEEYEKCTDILTGLRRRLDGESENAQRQAAQLDLQSRAKLDELENQWRAFCALKKDVAVQELSRHLGRKAARAKVESILAAERLRHDESMKLRFENIKLSARIHGLEAKLCGGQDQTEDPLQLRFERLQAQRLELKKQAEKQNEESLKIEKKIGRRLELLSNIKEKLSWSQMEAQAKEEHLAELESMVARKRDVLTRTKRASGRLQRDNLRLREQRGLLGNTVLLRDFDDAVDASDHLEEQLGNLKEQQAEIMFRCGRRNKQLETV